MKALLHGTSRRTGVKPKPRCKIHAAMDLGASPRRSLKAPEKLRLDLDGGVALAAREGLKVGIVRDSSASFPVWQ
jgi:hypothetical protein